MTPLERAIRAGCAPGCYYPRCEEAGCTMPPSIKAALAAALSDDEATIEAMERVLSNPSSGDAYLALAALRRHILGGEG